MALQRTRRDYFNSEAGKEIIRQLNLMNGDDAYNTASTYSANTVLYPDNLKPFVDKHMDYLVTHPLLEANKYLANIKLLTRLR